MQDKRRPNKHICNANAADEGGKKMEQGMSVVASELRDAARVVEHAAVSLAGEVSGGQVTHLMLLSQQLDRIAKTLTD